MLIEQTRLTIETRGRGLTMITRPVQNWLSQWPEAFGQVTLFVAHTSCSLTIQENADPDVRADLTDFMSDLVPDGPHTYRHTLEGPDDMPAHIKSALTDVSLTIPVSQGRMTLGTWQGLYLFEHRDHPQRRNIIASFVGLE